MSIFPTKILLATDGSEEAALAARTAADLADKTGSELHVLYAAPMPPVASEPSAEEEVIKRAQQFLDDQVKQIETGGGTVAQAHLRLSFDILRVSEARPDEEIVILGEEIDAGLVVVGSRGMGGVRRALMGSISDSVVRHAHCPVLVVRGKEE
jgi:nucleotide-binding universal stress UspA family protein